MEQALGAVLQRLGPHLRSVPDGETGERRNWIVHIVEALASHPDLERVHAGDWSDYDRRTRLRIRPGHRLRPEALNLGYAASFQAHLRLHRQLRARFGLTDLPYQVGIPSDLDLALFALGPAQALRHRHVFTIATAAEIGAIHALAGDEVLFQLEVPVELVLVARAPRLLRSLVARVLAQGVARLAQRAPAGARFGVHLCLGDLGNRALCHPRDAGPIVSLTGALIRCWPAGRPLAYVHAPFAAGETPAPLAAEFYAPLTNLRLPERTRFIAGLLHEQHSLEQLRVALGHVEQALGFPVDVAAACGLGRRTPESAVGLLQLGLNLIT